MALDEEQLNLARTAIGRIAVAVTGIAVECVRDGHKDRGRICSQLGGEMFIIANRLERFDQLDADERKWLESHMSRLMKIVELICNVSMMLKHFEPHVYGSLFGDTLYLINLWYFTNHGASGGDTSPKGVLITRFLRL
jgi:hypothetical protein